MTHDSIGLGEDGPTHQPIEHLASFRAMPNMNMIRPCGGNETAGAYKVAIASRKRPTTIALSRQGMPNLPGCSVEGVEKGAYGGDATPDCIIIGTGSELPMAVEAAKKLEADGKKVSRDLALLLLLLWCVQWCVTAGCRRAAQLAAAQSAPAVCVYICSGLHGHMVKSAVRHAQPCM
jgi:hypothetical protein